MISWLWVLVQSERLSGKTKGNIIGDNRCLTFPHLMKYYLNLVKVSVAGLVINLIISHVNCWLLKEILLFKTDLVTVFVLPTLSSSFCSLQLLPFSTWEGQLLMSQCFTKTWPHFSAVTVAPRVQPVLKPSSLYLADLGLVLALRNTPRLLLKLGKSVTLPSHTLLIAPVLISSRAERCMAHEKWFHNCL